MLGEGRGGDIGSFKLGGSLPEWGRGGVAEGAQGSGARGGHKESWGAQGHSLVVGKMDCHGGSGNGGRSETRQFCFFPDRFMPIFLFFLCGMLK
jgi:hypothetical protein